MSNKPNLSVIGLGKLGAPMVAAFASQSYKVIGVDAKPSFVQLINEGKPPVFETHLKDYLRKSKERISATLSYEEAVLNSDITFIIVPTPSDENNDFSMKYVLEVGEKIGKALKEKPGFHLVVLTSTVTPGSTENQLLPVLEKNSDKKCGVDFGLCYNPEFIALGSVIDDLLNPDFVLIGESDENSGDILELFYKNICQNRPPIKRMSIINAEITKIALNTYVTTKISYANMLAELCEKIPGANVDVVTEALGADTRIGHKYLKGALGYMGPCFPRDNRAFIHTAEKFGISLPIARATDEINRHQVPRLVERILSILPKNGKITILGLSYKPNTNVIEESQGLELAKALSERGTPVNVYDPKAMEEAKKYLNNVLFANSLEDSVQAADLILIATPWEEFKSIAPDWLKEGAVLFDCWRILDSKKYANAVYLPLGVNAHGTKETKGS
jgi:UDPglucose 6-dehydrogenase